MFLDRGSHLDIMKDFRDTRNIKSTITRAVDSIVSDFAALHGICGCTKISPGGHVTLFVKMFESRLRIVSPQPFPAPPSPWIPGELSCSTHGAAWLSYKCCFCCQVATWFCWGTHAFCSRCHSRQKRYPRFYLTPRCPTSPVSER